MGFMAKTVREVMSKDVACCTPSTPLKDVAAKMVECSCGEIPVVDGPGTRRPLGVVTDRDIVCRILAQGRNPLECTAGDCLSTPALTVTPDTRLDDCRELMQQKQVRRMVVVDASGACCGIVSQADLALNASKKETGELVGAISERR